MVTDKTKLLAAERQEPYSAAEHAEAAGLQAEYARDVPRACSCTWLWNPGALRYETIWGDPECPWHDAGAGPERS
jgi:hypothetical protein